MAEKISRLEAAQKKARIDIAVRAVKAKTQQKIPVLLSPIKKTPSRVPKRKIVDSLRVSSADEDEVLEEIVTDGAKGWFLLL